MTGFPLLEGEITVDFPGKPRAVDGVRLHLGEGEVLGLAGESGSGKSTIALAILQLVHRRGGRMRGSVRLRGEELVNAGERVLRSVRGKQISLMLQNPMSALNPRLRLGTQFKEAWRAHGGRSGEWQERASEILERLGLAAGGTLFDSYPRELSIGMAQRVLLALTILHRPSILIADEPTSALDLLNQAELLRLFGTLRSDFGMSLLFISHDLVALASVCDRIAVLRNGKLTETLAAEDLFGGGASDPYTRSLAAAVPRIPASEFAAGAG